MAKRKALSYSIKLRGARGGFTKISSAKTFEIFYGKRRVYGPVSFSSRTKSVAQKRRYLATLVKRIEKKRLLILEERRHLALAKKRAAEERKRHKSQKAQDKRRLAKVRKQIGRPEVEIKKEVPLDYYTEVNWAWSGLPAFNKAYAEPSPDFKNVVIKDTTIIPVHPESKRYDKRTIEKMLYTQVNGDYRISILDFTMEEKEYFPMDSESMHESYLEAMATFLPHIRQYFEDMKRSTHAFNLRIKFLWQGDSLKARHFVQQGVSKPRRELRTREGVDELVRETFRRLAGPTDSEIIRGQKSHRNYLVGERMILITGFTMEAVSYDERERRRSFGD